MFDARGIVAMVLAALVGGLVVALFSGIAASRGQAKRPAAVLEAEKFMLKDAKGTTRALLYTDTTGAPHLSLLNAQGHRAVTLSVQNDGSGGLLVGDLDQQGNMPSALVITPSGSPELSLVGKGTISLRFERGEGPKVLVFDEAKTLVFEAPPPP